MHVQAFFYDWHRAYCCFCQIHWEIPLVKCCPQPGICWSSVLDSLSRSNAISMTAASEITVAYSCIPFSFHSISRWGFWFLLLKCDPWIPQNSSGACTVLLVPDSTFVLGFSSPGILLRNAAVCDAWNVPFPSRVSSMMSISYHLHTLCSLGGQD